MAHTAEVNNYVQAVILGIKGAFSARRSIFDPQLNYLTRKLILEKIALKGPGDKKKRGL